jgi:hypothetical protein
VISTTVDNVPNAVIIQRPTGKPYFTYTGASLTPYSDNSEILQSLAAASLSKNSNGKVSFGEYLAMSPSMRQNFRPAQDMESILLANCPADFRRSGACVSLVAYPLGKYSFRNLKNDPQAIASFDFGPEAGSSVSEFECAYLVTQNAIKKIPLGVHGSTNAIQPSRNPSETNAARSSKLK